MMAVFNLVPRSVILCYFIIFCVGLPLENTKNELSFEDDWDYHIEPHKTPLLSDVAGNNLHPVSYEYEQDLRVASLNKDAIIETRKAKNIADVMRSTISCGVCKLGVGLLDTEVKINSSFDVIKKKFVNLCVGFQIETESVCTGFFDVYGPEVLPAYRASDLGPSGICKMVFGENCDEVSDNEISDWNIDIPSQTRTSRSSDTTNTKNKMPKSYKVLQLSDVHYDPDYTVGSPSNCEEPLCCRSYSTPPQKDRRNAGRWGAYDKCDSPQELLENALKNIALQHPDIDYILWTGDLVPHDIWNQTKEKNLYIIKETVRWMVQFFPDVPIFPAIGNHESVPAGNFAPPWMTDDSHSIKWLYSNLTESWGRWLPASSADTMLHGGFYSVLLRPGFRLISINTNYCHTLSWWLMVNDTDPAKQLKWLVYELQKAEENEEKVHLIGHIPPGSTDCMKIWSKNFYSIIERYQNTILAQYYGHSHADEFEIFYDTKEFNNPINIAYLGPSLTTYENFNPSYRIYYVDTNNKEILDHETWTMDLEEANKEGNQPIWYKLYSARDEYTMGSLKPNEWNRLINRMLVDDDLFDLFYRNYHRDSPTRPGCNTQCKLQILCDLKTARSQDRKHLCRNLIDH